MQELWQLYDEQRNPLPGQGAGKDDVYKGLLHGAAHVWIWRRNGNRLEVLVQKRAAGKRTWPNLLDISAAGHIDLGETPLQAAIRETQEEVGLSISPDDLQPIAETKQYLTAPDGSTENELIWLYGLEFKSAESFDLQAKEVGSVTWKDFDTFAQEVRANDNHEIYVPHGKEYFETVLEFISAQK